MTVAIANKFWVKSKAAAIGLLLIPYLLVSASEKILFLLFELIGIFKEEEDFASLEIVDVFEFLDLKDAFEFSMGVSEFWPFRDLNASLTFFRRLLPNILFCSYVYRELVRNSIACSSCFIFNIFQDLNSNVIRFISFEFSFFTFNKSAEQDSRN